MTVTPSGRSTTSIRCGLRGPAPESRSATSSSGSPSRSATAAAASALWTWCSPTSRSAHGSPSSRAGGERERGAAGPVERDAGRPDRRVRGRAEGHDVPRGDVGHRGDAQVVRVEHRGPAGGEARDDLGLRPGDGLDPAELAQVRAADDEHDGDVGRRDVGEVREVPDPARAHLEDEEAGRLVGPQHRERQPDLVVERGDRRDRRAGRASAAGRGGPWSSSCRRTP